MTSRSAISGARRAARVRQIVEGVMVRRARGESVSDGEVIAAHGELMPELGKELSLLGLLERAKDSVTGRTRTGRRVDAPIEPMGEDAFSGFRVVGELRRGGQGVVYDAVQLSTGRRVAIKMMREGHFAGDRDAARFEREVRILGQLDHPGVVGILASGIRGGHFYYVMDFVEGVPLDQHAASVGRRAQDVMRVMEKVADAVNAAHLRGIIHRDLKPGNILVDASGQARILDFGLARIVSDGESRMTATGQFVGSMPWASPEQAGGDQAKIDLRTDVYSLGVILYHALTGRFPYNVESGPREVLDNIARAVPARLRSASGSVDEGAEAVTLKCLSKERERRYQSAGELAADIRRYLSGRAVLAHAPSFWYQARAMARRHRALVIGACAVLLVLVLGLIGTSLGLVQASAARRTAVRERDAAEKQAYAASITAADSALRVDDAGTAKAHLRSAPEHLRGWEWRYLAARADQSVETLALPPVWDCKVAPDGAQLLMILRDGTVRYTDLSGGNIRWTSPIDEDIRTGMHHFVLAFSGTGLAITQSNQSAIVWRLSDGARVQRFDKIGTWGLSAASFSPDGRRVATHGQSANLKVWDLRSGELLLERDCGETPNPGAAYSPDGSFIAVSAPLGLAILDAEKLETVRLFETETPHLPEWAEVRYTPDGSWVITNWGKYIVAFDPEGKRPRVEFRGGVHLYLDFSLNAEGTRLAAGSWDRTVRVWDFASGKLLTTLVGHEERVWSTTFAGERVVSTGADGLVKVWDTQQAKGRVIRSGSHWGSIVGAGDRALFWGLRGSLGLVDLSTEQFVDVEVPKRGHEYSPSVSPDGRYVSSGGLGSMLWVWDLKERKLLWQAECTGGPVFDTEFSADGTELVNASLSMVEIRDAATGKLKRAVEYRGVVDAFVWCNPRRAEVAVTAWDKTFTVIDTSTGTSRRVEYPERIDYVIGGAYSPDGSLFASCDSGGGVLIWNTATWTPVRRLGGMTPQVYHAAFSPDGKRLAAASWDRMVHIFDTSDWRETLVLRHHSGHLLWVGWTPDGRKLLSTGYDQTMKIWDAGPAKWDVSR